jgi:hypothetical protein
MRKLDIPTFFYGATMRHGITNDPARSAHIETTI